MNQNESKWIKSKYVKLLDEIDGWYVTLEMPTACIWRFFYANRGGMHTKVNESHNPYTHTSIHAMRYSHLWIKCGVNRVWRDSLQIMCGVTRVWLMGHMHTHVNENIFAICAFESWCLCVYMRLHVCICILFEYMCIQRQAHARARANTHTHTHTYNHMFLCVWQNISICTFVHV